MINRLMKRRGIKSYYKDLEKINLSKRNMSISEEKDISYISDDLTEHKLDIYYKKDGKLKPILVDIHGGGFISSDKEINRLFGNYIAQNEFAVFNINYRLAYPEYNVFDQINDIDNALKWIVKNAEKYEGNVNEIYIMGHSSAGVLAIVESMLCNNKQMLKDFELQNRNYKYNGVVLDCGLMHFYKNNIAYWGMRNMVFPKKYKEMKKYQYLLFKDRKELLSLPKVVLITNKKDELKEMTYYFKEILDRGNVKSKIIDGGNDGHMGIVFKPYSDSNMQTINQILEYFK